jgi:hypothetical protein
MAMMCSFLLLPVIGGTCSAGRNAPDRRETNLYLIKSVVAGSNALNVSGIPY